MNDESIFAAALSKAPGRERRAFLDQACGRNDALRRRVERLLEADDQTAGILERGPDDPIDPPRPGERPSDRVGPYKLLQQIGEGGMGKSDRIMHWDVQSQVVRALINAPQPGNESVFSSRPPNGFSPDGKLLAVADNMHTRLWNTATGELVGYLAGPRESIWALSWSPDGKTLATTSGAKVKPWNVATRQELTTLLSDNTVGCHVFAPDSSLVVGNNLNKIRVWRTGLDQIPR
jgi:WD40 repeat protein